MYRVIDCLTHDHEYWLVGVAAFICVVGSFVASATLRRVISATGARKHTQLMQSGLITGATIWSTHFIAMLAYDPGVEHGYDSVLTAVSLAVAIVGSVVANAISAYAGGRMQYVAAGSVFGLTVSIMHYVGMSGYQLPGELIILGNYSVVSVVLGVVFGIASYHRIVFPVTRYCWMGGAILMVIAICAMHFTGMAAIEIRLDSLFDVPVQVLSDDVLGMLILAVVTLVLFVSFTAIRIETDIEHESVRKLRHAATHDHLTGLPNRLLLKERFDHIRDDLASDSGANIAVISIDLDLFKQVNDTHGHAVGDMVLIEIGQRLQDAISGDEFIARIGGDEFVALKQDLTCAADALDFANHIYDRIVPTIHANNCAVTTGASLGIATSINDGIDPDELLRKSDLSMFRAKEDVDVHICQYDEDMDKCISEKMEFIHDLRQALDGDQFELVYQLQNDTGSRAAVGCEVLLRWHHPTKGKVSPDDFIPLAEETGLIQSIGLWVLQTACFEAASWDKPWSIAVNVAPQQLAQPSFVENLSDALFKSGLAAERLELEVTEASVVHDQAFALKVLKEIKKMGVRVAMDDFGTGYSSLATLQTFPFDKIKIDRSFITDLHNNAHRAAIVRSTLSLGDAFGIPVLAEGVETIEELDFLSAEGCHYVQGFYFGKPMHVDDIRALTTNASAKNISKKAS